MTRLILTSTCAAALMAFGISAAAQTLPQAATVAQDPSPEAPLAVEAPVATIPAPAPLPPEPAVTEAPPSPPAAEAPTLTEVPSPVAPEASEHKTHDMSPMGMYNQADIVVKSVMIILAAASFVTWTIWLFKLIETRIARSRARSAARVLTSAQSLESAVQTLARRRDPAAFMAQAVFTEFQRSDIAIDPAGPEGVKERAVSLVNRVEVQAAARMRGGMGILATVGSVSPFVGLLGTVWGIMNSFIGIAETQTTNLAVVAPGIAEALFATAIGLVAAIPAVVIYNGFTRSIAAYKQSLGDAGAAALRLLSRDIDFRHVKGR